MRSPLLAVALAAIPLSSALIAGGAAAQTPPNPGTPKSPILVAPDPMLTDIRVSAFDSTGNKPLPAFRVIAGVRSGVSGEFEKRSERPVVNWQPHTLKVGKDGDLLWPLAKAYDEMALRVEADGYQPQIWYWIRKQEGPQHIVFQLAEDKGIAGRVLAPDGKPASGATIALALAQRDAVLEEGRLRHADSPPADNPNDQWRRPIFAKTDAEGRFTLPSEIEPAALLVVHESGVRELAYDAWRKAPDMRLQDWGRIEGRVLWKDKPGADEPVSLTVHRDDYGYPGMVGQHSRTKTDREGRFAFERVLPGHVQLSRPIKATEGNAGGISEVIMDGMFTHLQVKPGEPTQAVIGGQGRQLTGKLTGRDSWEGVTLHMHPNAPHIGFPGDDEQWKAFSALQSGPLGPLLFRDKITPAADGTFTIDNVLPGLYQVFVSAPGVENYAGYKQVRVEAEIAGVKPKLQELGEVQVKGKEPAKPAEKGAEKPADKPAPAPPSDKRVEVRGKAVDAETGKPVAPLIVQGGKFEPGDPTKITWGYFEQRSSATSGDFSTSVTWGQGWTARVLADGYLPEPVLTSAPPEGKDEITVTLKMRRGKLVKGTVLDHAGKPVKGAAVFAVGPTGLNLAGGKAWQSWGDENKSAKSVLTDASGRFEIPAGEAKSLAVSCEAFDVWPTEIAAEGETTIKLPQPSRVEVELNIDGAGDDGVFFYQLLGYQMKGFERLESIREFRLKNGGKLTLPALAPGKYQFCRRVSHHLTDVGMGAMLDRQFFELKPGETKSIRYVRDKGARVSGKLNWPAGAKLSGTIVTIQSTTKKKDPFGGHEWETTYASDVALADGTFITERLLPGKYLLVAEAYTPLTPEQQRRTGIIGPSFRAETTITVPETGEYKTPDLALKPVERGR